MVVMTLSWLLGERNLFKYFQKMPNQTEPLTLTGSFYLIQLLVNHLSAALAVHLQYTSVSSKIALKPHRLSSS